MKAAVRALYGKNLFAFAQKAFRSMNGRKLATDQLYLRVIVYHLEQLLSGETPKLLINLPGRHLKTFVSSICFPAFALGHNPSLKFMIVAYSDELAEDIVRQIREIMTSDWYQAVFKTRVSTHHSRKDDFTIDGGGRVRAVPVRSVTGKGGDIVILDDPHNASDWNNDSKKEQVIEAFELLISRRDGGQMSRMLVVGHRVAEDDLSAHIFDRGDFKHLCLPLVAPHDLELEFGADTLTLRKGEPLRPDAFPPDEINSIRRNHRGSPFWLYYQQGLGEKDVNPDLDVGHFPFLPGRLLGRDLPADVPVILSVDTSQKTLSSSRNVIHVYALRNGNYDFINAFAEKCTFRRLVAKVVWFARRYQAACVIVEGTARGPDLIEELEGKLSSQIVSFLPKGSKANRLRQCVPLLQNGKVRIRQCEAVECAIDEIVAFPYGQYDDHVDTLTNFLAVVPTLKLAPHTAQRRPVQSTSVMQTSGSAQSKFDGAAIAHGRSLFRRNDDLPDFSKGRPDDGIYVYVEGKKIRVR